jgi:signal transduction histidine kinase
LRCLETKPKLERNEEVYLASFNYNLSVLLSSSELNIESEEYLDKAISLCSKLDKKFLLSKCYVAYAQLYERREDYNKAIVYQKMALALGEEINEPYSIAFSKANLGLLLIKVNDYDKSFAYLDDALQFYQSNNMMFETGMVKFEIGQAYIHTGNFDKGLDFVTQAEDLMLTLDNKKELSEIFKLKSGVLAKKGDFAAAYEYLEKHVSSLRFFFDNEKTNALTRAKKEFETELKEKESKLLREKNEEIQEYVHKLEISNNELKQFAHVASHDLREPLRMISSYISLLRKSMSEKTSEQEADFFGYVTEGAKRMDQLIQDLLRLAKVDANPVIASVKLTTVIEEIKLNLDALIKEKNAVLQVGALPVIMADRAQMIQLFQNLIANGIKYNKSETPEIKITCLDRKDHFEIHVADNGIGIPKHLRDEAFQIFRRLHKRDSTSGSGIGLAICKKIVESMNGQIKIDDRPGGGTIFKITLSKTVQS